LLKTPLGRLRFIGFTEGVSFLVLLGIAMPLKYVWDWPLGVTVVGGLHGLLFVLYMAAVGHVAIVHRWPLLRILVAFLASLIPFGTFVLDARWKREQAAL